MRLAARPILALAFVLATSFAACSGRGPLTHADAGEPDDLLEIPVEDLATPPPDLAMLERGSCPNFCSGCKLSEVCLTTDATLATCLRGCTVTADCPSGWTCARVVTNFWTHQATGAALGISDGACINADSFQPSVCPLLPRDLHCDVTTRCSGQNLLQPIPVPGSCGWTLVACPRGCTAGSGGTAAHCN